MSVPRFVTDGQVIEVVEAGHAALNSKGKNGNLKVTINVAEDPLQWRVGQDLFSAHFITLGEALRAERVFVKTADG